MAVQIKDLKFHLSEFSFGPRSFELGDRGLYLLRGKNGTGKTSLLRCLLGRVRRESGEVRGLQFPIGTIGVEPLFIGAWTIAENIEWLCQLARIMPSAEMFTPLKKSQRFDRLSLGQRRQAELQFVVNLPFPTLLLDEPFTHLDQDHIARTASLIQKAADTRLVFLTSHQEVSSLKYAGVFEL